MQLRLSQMAMIEIATLALATWRLTSLLVYEDGPGKVFDRLRAWAGITYDEQNNATATTSLGEGLKCFWCTSVWCGTFWALLYLTTDTTWLALPFALSAAAILIDKLVEYGKS